MLAGKLNEIIHIEMPVLSQNELGEVVDNKYVKKNTTKAQVIWKNGGTIVDNNEIFTAYSVQFKVRIYVDVNESDRILFRSKRYKIDSIEISREQQALYLNCSLINE